MELWLAALLLLLLVGGIIALLLFARRRGYKTWTIVSIVIISVLILTLMAYVIVSFLFIDAIEKRPPTELVTTTPSSVVKTEPVSTTSVTTTVVTTIPELYIEPDPDRHPDVLGLRGRDLSFGPFSTQNEVIEYVLWNFLNNRFEFELSFTADFAVDEGTGYSILYNACETAMSYYLFSAYDTIDMFTVEPEEDIVYGRVKLEYSEPEFDQLAREEAARYVRRNPVPLGGFLDIESEKAYAKKIHDYLARRNTYSPIGYDSDAMMGMGKYEACQEAYNALVSQDKMTVCAGYARAFALIAQYADINAVWIYGNEEGNTSHAWNMIYPCDGSEAVVIDVTWDDTASDDRPGQLLVEDDYFYIPQSLADGHVPSELFVEFLDWVNNRD